MNLIERLKKLEQRLEMDGCYADANIVWLATVYIECHERAAQSEVPAADREGPEEVHPEGA